MAVRANWHIDLPEGYAPGDPFTQQLSIGEVGQPIELTAGQAKLNEKLIALVNDEGLLFEQGVECDLKQRPDVTCSACPVKVVDSADPLSRLCSLGSEQERVLTSLVVERERRGSAP